jgi:23S rRNA (pseudouridine1915-N3)-methyltransferase
VRIFVVAAGRIRDKALRAVADDYLERARHYARCDEIEVKGSKDLGRAVPKEATVVVLEPDGEALTSRGLAAKLERWTARGKGEVAFVIGGAEGIPDAVGKKAHVRLSLSTLTLPHRLARVVLLEQIYRSFTILRGEPYARED